MKFKSVLMLSVVMMLVLSACATPTTEAPKPTVAPATAAPQATVAPKDRKSVV